jgi:hypothetical protein
VRVAHVFAVVLVTLPCLGGQLVAATIPKVVLIYSTGWDGFRSQLHLQSRSLRFQRDGSIKPIGDCQNFKRCGTRRSVSKSLEIVNDEGYDAFVKELKSVTIKSPQACLGTPRGFRRGLNRRFVPSYLPT